MNLFLIEFNLQHEIKFNVMTELMNEFILNWIQSKHEIKLNVMSELENQFILNVEPN